MELLYVKKEGELFSIKNYNITYFLNEENVIHTIYPNMFPDDIEDSIENDFDCNYTILNNTYNLQVQQFPKLKSIIFNSYVILGLEKNSNIIQRIWYNNSTLYESDISERLLEGVEYFNNRTKSIIFLDIYKIEQLYSKKDYIVFLVRNKNKDNQWDYLLLLYEIILLNEGFSLNIENIINIKDIYKYDLINNSYFYLDDLIKIERIGYFDNYIFILFINENQNNNFIIYDLINKDLINYEDFFIIAENKTFFSNIFSKGIYTLKKTKK